MKALDRKLLRDLRLMWSQALTVALVVASGIAGFITSLSAVDSLALARDRYYAADRFADVFASVKRAPNALAASLRDIPGVADVQTSIEQIVRIDRAGASAMRTKPFPAPPILRCNPSHEPPWRAPDSPSRNPDWSSDDERLDRPRGSAGISRGGWKCVCLPA